MQDKSLSSKNPPIIIALDYCDINEALAFVDNINPYDCSFKVGIQMYTLYGIPFVQMLHKRGFKVFLDLKFHDIPDIVAQTIKSVAEIGIWMVNVHASGGLKMMMAAKEALVKYGKDAPLLIAVTVLTSMNQLDIYQIGINQTLVNHVLRLAKLTKECGLDGVVCSAYEASILKSIYGNDFLVITPGIRLNNSVNNDQYRTMTPKQAIDAAVDYMVIGRLITHSANPVLTLMQINSLIK